MPQPLQRAKHRARAVWLCAQPRGPFAGRERGAQGGDRGVRPVERDQWAARPRLQGPVGRRQEEGASALEARGLLKRAIETYLAGFQADWRDAYPGVNAVTLMEMQDKPVRRQAEMLPVVRFCGRAEGQAQRGLLGLCDADGAGGDGARQGGRAEPARRGVRDRPRRHAGLASRRRRKTSSS